MLTNWSSGHNYAPQACDSLRSLYRMPVPLRRAAYQSVMHLTYAQLIIFLFHQDFYLLMIKTPTTDMNSNHSDSF